MLVTSRVSIGLSRREDDLLEKAGNVIERAMEMWKLDGGHFCCGDSTTGVLTLARTFGEVGEIHGKMTLESAVDGLVFLTGSSAYDLRSLAFPTSDIDCCAGVVRGRNNLMSVCSRGSMRQNEAVVLSIAVAAGEYNLEKAHRLTRLTMNGYFQELQSALSPLPRLKFCE